MSSLVYLNKLKEPLSAEDKEKIIKDVCIKNTDTNEVIPFFKFDEEKNAMILPFQYAKLFNKVSKIRNPNDSISFPLRDHQLPIFNEAYNHLSNYNSVLLELPPGTGKTILGIYLSLKLNVFPVLITFPSSISSLAGQWQKTIVEKFGVNESEVCILDTPAKQSSLIDHSYKFLLSFDTRIKSVHNIPIKTLIIDEAHLLCTQKKVNDIFLNIHPRFVITLTGTFMKNNGMCKIMKLLTLNSSEKNSIYKLPSRPFKVTVHNITSPIDVQLSFNKKTKKMDFTKYCRDICENEIINKSILYLLSKFSQKKIIILTKIVEHSIFLKDLIETTLNTEVAILSGKNKSHVDKNILIGTIPKLSTGYDAENASIDYSGRPADTLILFHPIKSWQLFEQCKGRVMRCGDDILPEVHSISFSNLKFSSKHIRNLFEYIEKTNGKIFFNDIIV